MQPQLHDRLRHTLLRNPADTSDSQSGILLALDGHRLERPALPLALEYCKRAGKRLDILLLNPPKPATLMLGKFLQNLETAGIDYRLSSGEGELADQIPLYLRRYRSIQCVLLDKLDAKLELALAALRQNEYSILPLVDRGSKPQPG
jgi:hypothetical protein